MKTFKEFLEEAYKLPGEKIAFRSAYHGTSVPNASSIRKSGFRPGTRFDQDEPLPSGERIYVTTDKKMLKIMHSKRAQKNMDLKHKLVSLITEDHQLDLHK